MSFFDLLATVMSQIATGFVIIASGTTFAYPQLPALSPVPLVKFPTSFTITLPKPAPVIPATNTPPQIEQKELPKTVATEPISPAPNKVDGPAPSNPKPAEPAAPAVTNPVPPSPEEIPSPSENLGDVNVRVRNAVVNILCTTGGSGPLKPISGSGIIIDPKGVILTNAHVAQFMLLRDYPTPGNIDCVIRAGSPARTLYKTEVLYFPQQWLNVNAKKIISDNPTGTGEHDFALLRITGTTGGSPLPSTFPHVVPSLSENIGSKPVVLTAYPAGFFDGATIQTNLYMASARTTVGQVFTFEEGGGTDLFSVGGTILSQKGSSGGAVVSESDATLIGLIATATQAPTTAERDLRAITLAHISKSIMSDQGFGLPTLLAGDLAERGLIFNVNVLPTMRRTLIEFLEQ